MPPREQQPLPSRIARYELKYLIPFEWIEPISEFAAVYCSLDKYSLKSENGFYRVNNLYMDSPGYIFLRRRMENAPDRFNMRIRSYDDAPGQRYFLEIKRKTHDVIRKYRSQVSDPGWLRSFQEPGCRACSDASDTVEIRNRELFERLVCTYDAAPKILSQYLRKAWVSEVDDYARLTFDVDLRYMPETDYNLVPRESEMVSCDPETVFDPGCAVVLELKCTAPHVPLWMIDLIKYFNLHRTGFSKYMTGICEALQIYRYDTGARVAGI